MAKINGYKEVFESLRKILKKYEKKLTMHADKKDTYILIGHYSEKYKKELWFGGVQIKKNYVSYHLMPVYMYMELAKKFRKRLKRECRENHVLILLRLIKNYSSCLEN